MDCRIYCIVACLCVAGTFSAETRCWSDGNGRTTAVWWNAGEIIVRGSLYYECVQGQLVVRGCVHPKQNDQRIAIGQTYIKEQKLEMTCTKGPQGGVFFQPTACLVNGVRRMPDEIWQNDKAYFKCLSKTLYGRRHLTKTNMGCVVDGVRIRLKDTVEKNGGWYQCRRSDKGPKLELKGCVKDNRRLALGQESSDGDFGYQCTVRKRQAVLMTTNCIHEGEKLNSGDRFFRDGSVFQCEILYDDRANRTVKQRRLVGCVETDHSGRPVRERVIGCQWYHDHPGECRYEFRCGTDGKIKNVGCSVLKDGAPILFVPADGYTINYFVDTNKEVGVGCRRSYDGRLQYFEFDPQHVATQTVGLRYAEPVGRK